MDISRDQFDETKQVQMKVFQQGTHLADADLNELQQVLMHGQRRQLWLLAGAASKRCADGFKVVGTGASNVATVKAGFGIMQCAEAEAVAIKLAADASIGFQTAPSARDDYLYLDIYEQEIGSADDPDIVNPTVGQETCRDIRLVADFAVAQSSPPSSPPTGHVYVMLAQVARAAGDPAIEDDDVTNLLDDFLDPLPNIPAGFITGTMLADGTIPTGKIQDRAATSLKIGLLSVLAEHVGLGAIGEDQLAALSVSTGKVQDRAIIGSKIGLLAILAEHIASGAIGALQLADLGIPTAKLQDRSVTAAKIALLGVANENLGNSVVTRDKLADNVAGNGLERDAYGALEVIGLVDTGVGELVLPKRIVDFSWNMDTTDQIDVEHGLPQNAIKAVEVTVRPSGGTAVNSILTRADMSNGLAHGAYAIYPTTIRLFRRIGGLFDSTDYASAAVTVLIWYTA